MSDEVKKFFNTYTDFVTKVTSDPSLDLQALSKSFQKIENESSIKTPRLLTAALGDIMWYWVTACAALNLDPFEVIKENQTKLEARYGQEFEVERSEVRKEGDL